MDCWVGTIAYQFVLGSVMFSGEVKLVEFAIQMEQELHRLLEKWGLDGYLQKWIEHPYPVGPHKRLRQAIEAYETADQSESTGTGPGSE
jgi:hypothetical protein